MIRIAHLADIHIQNRRRDEYRAVFADLYAALRKEAPTVIAVVGDVFDDKMRASAHNLEDVAAFLAALADVAPVVLIPGNHDTDVTRPGSLDLLSPLLADHRLLTPPRLTYWRRSGVYCAHGVEWHVKAPDGPRPLAGAADDSGLPRVCLFHEELNGALLPNGQRLRDFALGRGDLAGYDAALGGHIHLRQQLGRAGYCGSLVQQNIGERHVGHGFVVWDLRPGPGHAPYRTAPPTVRGVDIPNRLGGFLRVVISAEGADRTAQPALPAPLYWELVHDARAPGAAVEAAAAAYTARLGQPPRAVRPCGRDGRDGGAPAAPALAALSAPGAPATPSTDLAEAHEAFSSPEAHAALIRRVLGATPRAEAVVALHAGRWQAGAAPALRGARVRLLRLEFDDLYCFGPGNVVDFTRLEGAVSGTVAPNHAGKSSLIEALLLALYEEHPRAATKAEVIRAGARGCRLALDFEIDGRRGRVEKAFGPGKGRAGYRLTYANEDRSQGDIPGTLREARALLGSAEAALATSVQLQGAEAAGFVAARPLERRRLLAAALELGRFTELERAAGRQLAELKGEARGLASQFCGSDAAALDRALGAAEGRAAAAGAAAVAADGEAASADACLASAEARAADARARVGEAPAAGVPESGAECLALRDAWLALAAENAGVLRAPGLARARARPPPPAGRSECGRSRLAAARAAKAQTAGALAAAQAAQAETENAHALLAARDEGLAQAAALAAGLEATRKGLDTQLGELRSLPLRQLAALFPELPEAPAAPPEPELPFPGFAERSGPRPEAGELAEALQLARAAEPGADLEAAARRADPVALAALRAGAAEAAEAEEPGAVAAAEVRVSRLAADLCGLPAGAVETARAGSAAPAPGPELEDLRRELARLRGEGAIQRWFAETPAPPRDDCPRCRDTDARFGAAAREATAREVAAAERALPAAELRAACAGLRALEAAEAELAAARERRAAAEACAQRGQRLRELEAAEAAAAVVDRRAAAVAAVERECHWRARAREAWAAASAARGRWIATLKRAALERKKALDKVLAGLGAGAPAPNPAATAEALARLQQARATAEMAARAAAEAARAEAAASLERREALEAAAFWDTAARAAAATARARAAELAAAEASAALESARTDAAARRVAARARAAEAAAADAEVARLRVQAEREAGRAAAAAATNERLATLQDYLKVLRPGGIAALLLEKARALVARFINDGLRELGAPLEADLTPEFALLQRARPGQTSAGPWLAASLASGYQKFVLGLAARLALWRLTAAPRLDALFIDEGFSSCDAEYLEGLGSALEALASAPNAPRLVFVVSHLDALKTRLERVLEIRRGPHGSRVMNAATETKSLPAAPAAIQSAPALAAALAPDPKDPAKLWCRACRQSLNAGNGPRHLSSQKHERAART